MILVFCKNEGLWSFHFEFYAMRSNTLFSGNLKQDIEKTLEIIPSFNTSYTDSLSMSMLQEVLVMTPLISVHHISGLFIVRKN